MGVYVYMMQLESRERTEISSWLCLTSHSRFEQQWNGVVRDTSISSKHLKSFSCSWAKHIHVISHVQFSDWLFKFYDDAADNLLKQR